MSNRNGRRDKFDSLIWLLHELDLLRLRLRCWCLRFVAENRQIQNFLSSIGKRCHWQLAWSDVFWVVVSWTVLSSSEQNSTSVWIRLMDMVVWMAIYSLDTIRLDQIQRLFIDYWTRLKSLHRPSPSVAHGIGLSLSIVSEMYRDHHGEMLIDPSFSILLSRWNSASSSDSDGNDEPTISIYSVQFNDPVPLCIVCSRHDARVAPIPKSFCYESKRSNTE